MVGACYYELPPVADIAGNDQGASGGGGSGGTTSSGQAGMGMGGASSASTSSGQGGAGNGGASATSSSSNGASTSTSSGGAPNPAVFVQVAFATPQVNQTTAQATYSKAQTAGNTNILAIGWNDVTSTLSSVADTAGNVYQQALGPFKSTSMSQAIYYASNIAATQSGQNNVIVTFSAAAEFIDLRITEYSGLSDTNPVDSGISKAGKGLIANTDAITTTGPVELLFAAGMTRGSFTGPGVGFTKRVITSPDGDIVQDRIAFVPGLASASAPLTDSEWLLQLVAFRPAP